MSPSRASNLVILLSALAAFGCASAGGGSGGGGGGKVRGGNFPSPDELTRLENLPNPDIVFDAGMRSSDAWQIQARRPERIDPSPYTERSEIGRLLAEAAVEGGPVPTEAMHCVASELARFDLATGGRPDLLLQRFISAACNSGLSEITYAYLGGEVPDEVPDERILEQWASGIQDMVRKVTGQQTGVGIGMVRGDGQVRIYLASGRRLASVEPVKTRLRPGEPFVLRGRSLVPAKTIGAAINRGRYGAAECKPVGEPQPPNFHFECLPDASDLSARVSLSILPPDRLLGRRILDAVVWSEAAEAYRYERAPYVTPGPVENLDAFGSTFVEKLNEVRGQAGLSPVALAAAQSATATELAPQFFAASGESETVADVIALGLLAGWDVDGDIRLGDFTSAALPDTDDVSALLGALLEDPVGRDTMLNADADRVAVGPIREESEGTSILGALIGSYDLFEDGTEQADAEHLLARLGQERGQRELPEPYRLIEAWLPAQDAADEVRRGAARNEALDGLLQTTAASNRYPGEQLLAWVGETSALDDFEFPEEILAAKRLGAAIGVSRVKGADEPWARYVVMLISIAH